MPATLTGLTDQPNQLYPIQLSDGTTVTLTIQFWPQQNGWFYDLVWDGQNPPFEINGSQLVASPNVLRQWREIIPFGIAVATNSGQDPTDQEDFVNGNCTLVLLNPGDVASVEMTYFPGD